MFKYNNNNKRGDNFLKILVAEKLSEHRYKTPEGYLICVDSILARTGKQTYNRSEIFGDSENDGLVEVDRKAEEVFSPETMASFENKPICVEHPDVDVNSGNISEFAVGFVRDIHKGEYEGEPVMLGTLVITDAKTVEEIEEGKHTDLSCGYDCDIDDSENPQQRNIRGNHVALCEQGRAGIARIMDSIKDEGRLIKGLVFETKEKISANSTLSLNEGIYKIGLDTYVLIFYSGTHQSKINELKSKQSKQSTQSEQSEHDIIIKEMFNTSVVNGYIDVYDLKRLTTGDLGIRLIELAKKYYGTNNIKDKLIESSSKEAFNKNVATEIKAGKDPKQAAAIAYSVQRKNDEESTYTEVTKNLEKEAKKDMSWLDTVVKDSKRITDFDDTPRNVRVVKEFIEKNGNKFSKSKDADKILDYIKMKTGIRNADYGDIMYIIKNYTRATINDETTEEIKDAPLSEYEIRWIDKIAKSRGESRESFIHNDIIKATTVKEALQSVANRVALGGIGTANTEISSVNERRNGKTISYVQLWGKLSDIIKKV